MTLSDLRDAAARMIELDGKATPGPWGKTATDEKADVCVWGADGRWLANVGNWARCSVIVTDDRGHPWLEQHPDVELVETEHDDNAAFIASARTDAPLLAAGVLALLDAIDEFRASGPLIEQRAEAILQEPR